MLQGSTAFAVALYRRLSEGRGNLFFSPQSISTALAMVAAGARGETLAELEKVLHLPLAAEAAAAADPYELVKRNQRSPAGTPPPTRPTVSRQPASSWRINGVCAFAVLRPCSGFSSPFPSSPRTSTSRRP